MKYIRTENDEIIVFPDTIRHDSLAHMRPKSAGFIIVGKGKFVACFGNSETLQLKSIESEDTAVAKKQFFL